MRPIYVKALILLIFVVSLLPVQIASADTGPKPTMEFTFTQDFPGEQVTIVSGTLFECKQPDCSDAKPLMEAGPQRLSCEAKTCHALAYGFSQYHRLEIEFSDGKTRQSNIFKTAEFNSIYNVTILQDSLLVKQQVTPTSVARYLIIPLCCFCLLGVVAIIVITIVLVRRKNKAS